MQDIGLSSRAAPPRRLGAFEKSVIVKWRRRCRTLELSILATILLLALKTIAPTQGANIEDLSTTISNQFSHLANAFSLGDGTDLSNSAHAQDNELGKTLATSFPIGTPGQYQPASIQPEDARQQTGSGRTEESPGNSKSDHSTSDLHVVDFGDHAEPSELATLLTLGGGGGGGGGGVNQTVVGGPARQAENNNLLKTNNDGNRTSGLDATERPTQLAGSEHNNSNNQQTNQQVGAGRPSQQSSQPADGQQPELLNIKHSSGNGKQERRRSKKDGTKKKRKRKKFPNQQVFNFQQQQQQNATAAGASLPPLHQMITYVSRDHPQPAHQFERLLSPSRPLARFLQPSAFKLALNSPALYRQLHLDDRHQPLEFGRYLVHTNSSRAFGPHSRSPQAQSLPMVGPFELEQLQATASTRQNKKVQHSAFSHNDDGGHDKREHAREPPAAAGGQQQLLQTHESSKLEQVNLGELATPTAGQPPAISDHLDDQDDGGDELNMPNSPQLDYETDEISGGGELFSSEQHLGEDSSSPNDAGRALMSSKRQVEGGKAPTSGQQVAGDDTGSGGNKTTRETNAGEEDDGRQVAAQSKSLPTIQVAQQQQQQQPRPGLKIANNELLVGPFKSEAEAPATITLAGVVYQKSGSSSALLRASPMTNGGGGGGGSKQVATADNNLDLSLALGPTQGQLRSERAGSSTTTAQSSVAPTAAAAATTTSSDWSQSMLLHNNMMKSQPPTMGSSVYLGTISQQSPALMSQTMGDQNTAGEQMSLSSSSAKPTTSSKSLASQLMGSNSGSELVIATGGSGASLLGASQPDLAQHLGYATTTTSTSQQQVPATAQLYQQRLPNGSIIWTLNKPGLPGGGGGGGNSLSSLMQAAASSDASSSSVGGGGLPFEVGVASSEPSESKHHHHHKAQGGPIVIVQKDVKPVKYHLLRAYLKLRRLLRPFEATYVFPGDHAPAASTSSATYGGSAAVLGAGGGVQVGSNAFLRRRQLGLLPNLHVTRSSSRSRWRARGLLGGRGTATAGDGGRLER